MFRVTKSVIFVQQQKRVRMSTIIQIPPAERDTRIGSVFNMLFKVVNSTECCSPYEEVVWDFSRTTFFHPFYICGLGLYRKHCGRKITITGLKSYTNAYLNAICFQEPLIVRDAAEADSLMNRYRKKSYMPICKFSTSENTIDSVTSGLQKIIQMQCGIPAHLISPLSYLIGELVANVHDHSKCDSGYIFSQYLRSERCLNICIADFGISVYGSFAQSRMLNNELMLNEGYVLDAALHHTSTKNLPDAENRGYGLPTTKNMLVSGMGGEFFILSGCAFHRHDRSGEVTVTLPQSINWDGTIVLLKIPMNVSDEFNYLKYVERL